MSKKIALYIEPATLKELNKYKKKKYPTRNAYAIALIRKGLVLIDKEED